ncbi:hypothetical protein [Mesorhizobium sp. M2C.T.Ca.TU.002.02.1.1]|jgi:hypothetical protein|uniref:hypothetical protein n=1 Tax=Mesorhizobium sp. M2C.T.Ca.TU.002.02.1.1 TaxID=2496788 RepID=UPI000FCA19A1|nr:hypothetical protein EOD07_08715 [Mesorhizobium sp. M2C.T.Ca.TU.002.02.1.1]RUU71765.1 hypothetical protein EOD04_01480 [Mesorhizobium sp. M2C.T.Ca.TU.009.01.2.1]
MTAAILLWSVKAAQVMLAAAMGCYAYRLIRGPRAQDRVPCLDAMYSHARRFIATGAEGWPDAPARSILRPPYSRQGASDGGQ